MVETCFQVGEAKKRLSCLTSNPMSPLDGEDGEGEAGHEGLKKGNRFKTDFLGLCRTLELFVVQCSVTLSLSEGLTSSSKLSSLATQ